MIRDVIIESHEVPLLPVVEQIMADEKLKLAKVMNTAVNIEIEQLGFQAVKVSITTNHKITAAFEMEQCPGCCAFGITSYMWVDDTNPRHTRKLLNYFVDLRERIAKKAKWGMLIATLIESQQEQSNILNLRKWNVLTAFHNPKTDNLVRIWGKVL